MYHNMGSEDATFNALRRTPMDDMIPLIVDLYVNNRSNDYNNKLSKLLKDHGWTNDEFSAVYGKQIL